VEKIKNSKVLVIGANYGLLFAALLLERGFGVDIFTTKHEADTLNKEGFEISSSTHQKKFNVSSNWRAINHIDDFSYSFIVLAVQEPNLSIPEISNTIRYLIKKNKIFLSIMNIPLYEFLSNISTFAKLKKPEEIYNSLDTTRHLSLNQIINSSPEPQISSESKFNIIRIRLGGAFRCSSLNMLDNKIIDKLLGIPQNSLPISIKTYSSPWVSLSKAPMLLTGNYRCIVEGKLCSISEAVNLNIIKSELIYNSTVNILKKLGARREHVVPFGRYVKSSIYLNAPSSVCRSIVMGNSKVERVDKLIKKLGVNNNIIYEEINEIVYDIDKYLLK
jgi:hypothetical protein